MKKLTKEQIDNFIIGSLGYTAEDEMTFDDLTEEQQKDCYLYNS